MDKMKVGQLKKFITPLKAIKGNMPSVVFTRDGNTFQVNVKSDDASKLVNLRYKPETVKVKKDSGIKKLGIHDLDEFITICSSSFGVFRFQQADSIDQRQLVRRIDRKRRFNGRHRFIGTSI